VTGASGGVGSAAVQLAKARGAKVIGISATSKSGSVLNLGADQTISRNDSITQTLGRNSIDGAIGGPLVDLDVRTLYLRDLSLFGCTVLDEGVFGNLIKRIEANDIVPVVAKTFPLEQLIDAQNFFETKGFTGKLVVDLSWT